MGSPIAGIGSELDAAKVMVENPRTGTYQNEVPASNLGMEPWQYQ